MIGWIVADMGQRDSLDEAAVDGGVESMPLVWRGPAGVAWIAAALRHGHGEWAQQGQGRDEVCPQHLHCGGFYDC